MAAEKLWRTAVFMTLCVVMVTSYPHGAPDSACATLTPDSHGPSTATGPSPYILRVASRTYSPGQVIAVQLVGALFKGFLVVGRRADGASTDPVGYFENPTRTSRLACTAFSTGNGITQTNNTVEHTGNFLWRAPNTTVGDIRFHYTVIRGAAPSSKVTASDYYAGLTSEAISPAGFDRPIEKKNRFNEYIAVKIEEAKHKVSFEMSSFEQIIFNSNLYKA